MLFFSKERNELHKAYSNLFGLDDEDMEEEDEDEGTEGANGRSGERDEITKGFSYKWGHIYWIDQVAEITHNNWDTVLKMGVIEFLNILCYIREKNNWEKESRERYMRQHKLK